MKRKLFAVLLVVAVISTSSSAWGFGIGLGYRLPSSNFGDLYDGGFGANVAMFFPVAPKIAVYGDVGYTQFQGKEIIAGIDADNLNVWGFNAGAKFSLTNLYFGGELGYFTEVDEFSLSPLVGIGLGPIDVSARYKLGDFNWWDFRASISLGR